MVASAQLAYPAADEEKEEELETEEEKETIDIVSTEESLANNEETEANNMEGSGPYVHEESGRPFDVSSEDFCADPYEQCDAQETRQELGKRGEEAATKYLISKGYKIIKRNWYCRFGEADIIARDTDGTLCFVEVKTRKSIEAGFPEESITKSKRRRYERIALAYMMISEDWEDNDPIRFDAICICVSGPHRAMLRHHKGCFHATF